MTIARLLRARRPRARMVDRGSSAFPQLPIARDVYARTKNVCTRPASRYSSPN